MAISITPPTASAYFPSHVLAFLPRIKPAIVTTKATAPMIEQAMMIFTLRNANDNPTARASILVATARVTRRIPLLMSICFRLPSGRNDSHIILPPISASKTKATQWSYAEIKFTTVRPAIQPRAGIMAWNAPKVSAIRKMGAKDVVLI